MGVGMIIRGFNRKVNSLRMAKEPEYARPTWTQIHFCIAGALCRDNGVRAARSQPATRMQPRREKISEDDESQSLDRHIGVSQIRSLISHYVVPLTASEEDQERCKTGKDPGTSTYSG